MRSPVETKVAASGGIGALVSLLFGLAAQYHWFAPPSPYLTALTVTVVSFLAGWLAPHSPRGSANSPLVDEFAQALHTLGLEAVVGLKPSVPAETSTGAGEAVVVQPSATAKQAP